MTDGWNWPSGWLEAVLPRRVGGGKLGGEPPVPPSRVEDGRERLAEAHGHARSWLAIPDRHDPALADAALRCLDGPPAGPTPEGVAAVLTAAMASTHRWHSWGPVVDVLLDDFGPAFTASTVAELAGIDMVTVPGAGWALGRFARWPTYDPHAPWADVARAARVRLARVPDADHVRVVAALAPYREGGYTQRCVTSYLAPDQTPWVAADCADAAAHADLPEALLLFGAAATVEQYLQVGEARRAHDGPEPVGGVATLLDVLGVGAVPVLARWAAGRYTRETLEPVWNALVTLRTDAAFAELFGSARRSYVMAYVRRAMDRDPERAMRVLAESEGADDLLRDHVVTRPDVAGRVLPGLADGPAGRIRRHLGGDDGAERAPAADLPPLLHRPPWTAKKRVTPAVVTGLEAVPEAAVAWLPGERAARTPRAAKPDHDHDPRNVEVLVEGLPHRHVAERLYAHWPAEVLRPVLGRLTISPREYDWQDNDGQWILATRFGVDALPAILDAARRKPKHNLEPLLPFASTEVALLLADVSARLASTRAVANRWFLRHPGVAARALVPPALGKAGRARRQAERILRLVAASGAETEVRAAAAAYGHAAAAGVDALLRTDPLEVLPSRIPVLPAWLDPRLLPPLRLPDGRVLPVESAGHVCTVLALSTLEEPYAGVDVVRATCDPASLEAFVWAMFERWGDADHPTKERWVFTALGLIGSDVTVERLVPLLDRWPSHGAQARAVLGLDILGAIGTDRALMHLDRFARKAKTSMLRAGAQQRIEAIAAARELTPEQLADRLVPDFDLDADGRMTLDYGPRTFTVGFDEQLRPFTADEAGKRLKTLPKPGARDDAEKAAAGYERFAELKRTVRTIAAEQIRRFEHAMVWQRRWTAAELATLFVAHPLLRHLVRRVVWGVYDAEGALVGAFRIAEDGTYADADDDPCEVAGDATVGVAHPLELGKGWAEVFADYAILQPFPQLGRETYDSVEPLGAFVGRATTGGRALSLQSRGWSFDDADRGGDSLGRPLPGSAQAHIRFEPGMEFMGGFDPDATQTVRDLGVHGPGGPAGLAGLSPVARSELLRDLNHVLR